MGFNDESGYHETTYLKIIELKINLDTNEFYFESKYESFDLNKNFGITKNDYLYNYYQSIAFVTDNMNVIYVLRNQNKICFNDQDCSHMITNKLGKSDYDQNLYKTLIDFNVKVTNAGVSIYNNDIIYQLKIDHKKNTLMPLMKINFDLGKSSVNVSSIYCCRSPNYIIVQLSSATSNLILIWDVNLNQEYKNFSCNVVRSIILSKLSKTGILLMDNSYVNLDRGIINYYFNSDFDSCYYSDSYGLRMNSTQNMLVSNGIIYCKESIFGCLNYLEVMEDKENAIKEKNLNFERIKHQIGGNTLVHEYALEFEPLSLILEYFEEYNSEYLRTILLENSKRKSPLILAIEGESPKNIELMLKKLALFKTDCYSSLFYDKFIDLLQMNLKAFHIYLESCFFQTMQMKATKYLKLNSDKDPWLVTHSSCLIDKVFIDKYCSNDQKRIQDIERRKREEDERKKKEQEEIDKKKQEENEKQKELKVVNESRIEESKVHHIKSKEELELENERKKQKTLDIKAIEFDWIFDNKKRSSFIKALSTTDDLDLFSINLIRNLILYLWSVCWKYIMIYVFLPFAFYFVVFVVYVTYVHKNKAQNGENYSGPYGIAQIICIVITLLIIIYQGFYEAKQIWFNRLNYLLSFWNLVDLISLILNFTVCISDLAGIEDVRFVPLSAVAVLFMYLKFFYFGRIFISTAAMVRMVIAIIYDMRYFLMVFLLACAGFGNCFFILAKNDTSSGIFTGDTYFKAFLYSYQQALGAFDVSAYDAVADKHLLYFIWFFNTLILFIILLNMIVAVMGDTFDKVQETAVNNILKEIVSIMFENELLFNSNNFSKGSKYIIVIQEEKAEEESESVWDGKLKRIKKHLENSVTEQNKILKELENHFESSFRIKAEQRAREIESVTDRNFEQLSFNYDMVDKLITKCMKSLNQDEKVAEQAK